MRILPILAIAALVLLELTTASGARADWPTSPTVNVPICTSPGLQLIPSVASDLAGGVIIAWYDQRGVDFDVYAQHVFASGALDPAWPLNGRLVCNAAGNQSSPKVVSDGAGGVIVAWQDSRAGTASDIYAHHLRGDGALDPAWSANGLAVCTAAGVQSSIAIVGDAAGGALLLWRDTRNDTDLYAMRVLASGQVDPGWPANGLAVASGAGAQLFPNVVSDRHGGMLLAWQDFRNGPTPDIYAQHLLVNGTLPAGWTVNGVAVCNAAEAQQFPSVDYDGAGGALVGWEDLRNGVTTDIFVQHVRANGTMDPTWPANGAVACAAGGNQTRARVATDAAGGLFVGWTDARAGSIPALYAQHVLANGSLDPAWPAADLAFCPVFGSHLGLTFMADGTGGVLAVWDDARSGLDVYASHMLASGSVDPLWPLTGRAVSTATQGQNAGGAAIPDGSGGLIVAWSDTRAIAVTNNDIYAQRVQANGQLGGSVLDAPVGPVGALELAALAPTPSRSGRFGMRYSLPRGGDVSFALLDVSGRLLASRELGWQPAGAHAFEWDLGLRVPPGLHFVRLGFGPQTRTVRAVTLD